MTANDTPQHHRRDWYGDSYASTGVGARAGNITITGTGGTARRGLNYGVYLLNTGGVTAAGPGTITMTGTGGATSGDDIRTETVRT